MLWHFLLKLKEEIIKLKIKLEVYQELKAGIAPSDIASKFSIARSTISSIKKFSGPKVEAFLLANPHLERRKTLKSGAYPILDKALKVFFDNQRSLGKPIYGTLLQEKAQILHEKLCSRIEAKEPRELSHGLIEKFEQRQGIRSLKCVGEKGSADKSAVEPFIHDFLEMIVRENFTRDQIYNADETGLCWRAIPTRTLVGPGESKVNGAKAEKERVTLMACSNASETHKLDLVFIHKYENPRALKHINKDKLPVKYYSQSKVWMTTNLHERWFSQEFVPAVKSRLKELGLEDKVILVLDNAPSHTKLSLLPSEHSNIHCVFFLLTPHP